MKNTKIEGCKQQILESDVVASETIRSMLREGVKLDKAEIEGLLKWSGDDEFITAEELLSESKKKTQLKWHYTDLPPSDPYKKYLVIYAPWEYNMGFNVSPRYTLADYYPGESENNPTGIYGKEPWHFDCCYSAKRKEILAWADVDDMSDVLENGNMVKNTMINGLETIKAKGEGYEPTQKIEQWLVTFHNTETSGSKTFVTKGTKGQIKKLLANFVCNDEKERSDDWLEGTTSVDDIIEDDARTYGDLLAYASFDGYCYEYTATRWSGEPKPLAEVVF